MRRDLLSYQCVAGCLLVISSIAFGRIAVAEASFEDIMQGAKPIGEFRLCESSHTGQSETYSCKDYLSARGRLRLVYQGGPAPQAIYHERQPDVSTGPTLLWVNSDNPDGKTPLYYGQESPSGVPSTASYRGTGVCLDDEDQSVPCSMFEQIVDENAAITEIQRYFVFYNPMGNGPSHISVITQRGNQIVLGNAKHKRLEAFMYELAYLLGEALLNTEGYRERGEAYLKYAHKLHPDSAIHGETRQEAGPELFPKADLNK